MTGENELETRGFEIEGSLCMGMRFKIGKAQLLVIKGRKGYLACGYVDAKKSEELGDAAAFATGVSSFDELLSARISVATSAAKKLGVREGMTGRQALGKMCQARGPI